MFNPKKIDNFLSSGEVEYIKNTVHAMRDDWRHISTLPIADANSIHRKNIDMSLIKSAENQYFLGDAIYTIDSFDQIDWKIQDKLYSNFKDMYDKLLLELSKHYPNPYYADGHAKPAFHVFHGEQKAFPFQWHIDTTLAMFDRSVNPNNIHSFLCCIETPKDKAGLEYKDTMHWHMLEETESMFIDYDVGSLYTWNGSYIHRMRQFDMDADESRITLQGHLYFSNGTTRVYW
jgi:hypothetical protein